MSAATRLAELVTSMDMVTPKGVRARELARAVLAADDELLTALRLIEHATAPTHDDGAYHEAAHDLASAAIRQGHRRAAAFPGYSVQLTDPKGVQFKCSYREADLPTVLECAANLIRQQGDRFFALEISRCEEPRPSMTMAEWVAAGGTTD